MKFATKAIHVGSEPDPRTGAIMPPIYMTSTFVQDAPGESRGYDYTRAKNPNFTILEELAASLEEGKYATVFSSGLGALTAMATRLDPEDHVMAVNGVYGGTYRFFNQVFHRYGIRFSTILPKTIEELDEILSCKPKWLLFETPTNPLLEIFDIEGFSTVAKQHGVTTIVDNTFASPYYQNPLKLGVDVVWHSSTKYIGGHSDIIGGIVVTNDSDWKNDMDFKRLSLGVNPSPFDVWLATRGVKTLAVRMEQHQKNAFALAQFLEQHPKVKRVYYPGLANHRGHEVAKKQMSGYSGVVSVEFAMTLEETKQLISSFRYFALAESLGGVESLVNHPATMTHAAIPKEQREKIGLSDGLVRFSLGIENAEDLIEDIEDNLSRF
ncbi:MAG: PLP-dependent aspartate aminotransferase family protein [Waddliaceae bacterium]